MFNLRNGLGTKLQVKGKDKWPSWVVNHLNVPHQRFLNLHLEYVGQVDTICSVPISLSLVRPL